jgi:phage shock protein E
MSWNLVLTIGAILIVVVVLKRIGLISLAKARTHLKNGAMLVDVRSKSEFESGRITGAVNVPLNDLQNSAQRHLKDKNRVLLLHCHSGTRSAMACRALKQMGYANVFNLGSFSRAQRVAN